MVDWLVTAGTVALVLLMVLVAMIGYDWRIRESAPGSPSRIEVRLPRHPLVVSRRAALCLLNTSCGAIVAITAWLLARAVHEKIGLAWLPLITAAVACSLYILERVWASEWRLRKQMRRRIYDDLD